MKALAVPRSDVDNSGVDRSGRRATAGRPAAPRDVRAVLREGRVAHGGAMVLRALPRGDDGPVRLAVVASRKLGGAVDRNRARRRLREALRHTALPAGVDLVVVAKSPALTAPFDELVRQAAALVAQTATGAEGAA